MWLIPVIEGVPAVLCYGFFVLLLVVVSIIDLRHRIIPDKALMVGVLVGAALLLWARPLPFTRSVVGGLAGFLMMLVIALAARGGMGGGDVKLAGVIGFFLGPVGCLLALFIGFVSGAVVALSLVVFRTKGFRDFIPYGPFLALGSVVALFWGNDILRWYFDSWLR